MKATYYVTISGWVEVKTDSVDAVPALALAKSIEDMRDCEVLDIYKVREGKPDRTRR